MALIEVTITVRFICIGRIRLLSAHVKAEQTLMPAKRVSFEFVQLADLQRRHYLGQVKHLRGVYAILWPPGHSAVLVHHTH